MHGSGNYAFLTKNEVNSQWGFPTNNSTHRTNILTYQNISNHNLKEWNTFVWQERSFSLYLLSWVKKLVWIFTLKMLIINKWLRRAKTSQKNTKQSQTKKFHTITIISMNDNRLSTYYRTNVVNCLSNGQREVTCRSCWTPNSACKNRLPNHRRFGWALLGLQTGMPKTHPHAETNALWKISHLQCHQQRAQNEKCW